MVHCVGGVGAACGGRWHGVWAVTALRLVGNGMGPGWRWCGLWGSRWRGVWLVMVLRRGVRSRWRGLWTEIELCVGGYDSP